MFHYTPRHCSPTSRPYYQAPTPSTYDAYDARRSQLEQLALARRQQERREAEEALIRRRQQELAIDKEVERQKIAAYEAALEQRLYESWLQDRRAQTERQAVFREQQRRQAIEAEHTRRIFAQRQQEEQLRRRQEQARSQQRLAEKEQQAEGHDTIELDLTPLLQLFFGPIFGSPAENTAKQSQAESKPIDRARPAPRPTPSPLAQAALASTTAPDVTTTQSETSEALKQHYATHLHRREAFTTLVSLAESLAEKQAAFDLPTALTFQPSPPSSEYEGSLTPTATPKLAFQSTNAPFLAYEDFLVALLSRVDAISSGGDRKIKQARKELVKRVDAELAKLDAAREEAWSKQQLGAEAKESEHLATAVDPEQQKSDGKTPVVLTGAVEPELTLLSPADPTSVDLLSAPSDSIAPATASSDPTDPSPLTDAPAEVNTSAGASVDSTSPAPASESDSVDPAASPLAESAASSDTASDDTLSFESSQGEAAIDEVELQAQKMGEEVTKPEEVEPSSAERVDTAQADDFVVV